MISIQLNRIGLDRMRYEQYRRLVICPYFNEVNETPTNELFKPTSKYDSDKLCRKVFLIFSQTISQSFTSIVFVSGI